MKRKILNPNCSEQVFRLTGSLEDIKKQVLFMIEVVRDEWRGEGDYDDKAKELLREKIKEIKKIKTLDEFYNLVFLFTCNYETFFKPDGYDVLVATCNNHMWDTKVDFIEEDNEHYYNISGHIYYDIIAVRKDWILVKRDEDKIDNQGYFALETKDIKDLTKFRFSDFNSNNMQLRRVEDRFIFYSKILKLIFTEVKDKEKRRKILDIGMVETL